MLPPTTTHQHIPPPTTIHHHPPLSTTTHQQPKYIHHHSSPLTTTHRQPKYINQQQQSKIYPSKKVFHKKNIKIFYSKVNNEKHFD